MQWFSLPDWGSMLTPDQSLIESFLRATFFFFMIFTIMRVLPRRQSGEMSMMDMLLIVLVAEASSQSMLGESFAMPNGIVAVITLFFWNYFLQWLAMHVGWVERFVHAQSVILIKDGKLVHANLRREMITGDLLQSEIREQGLENVDEIKEARVEGDGKVTFIKAEK